MIGASVITALVAALALDQIRGKRVEGKGSSFLLLPVGKAEMQVWVLPRGRAYEILGGFMVVEARRLQRSFPQGPPPALSSGIYRDVSTNSIRQGLAQDHWRDLLESQRKQVTIVTDILDQARSDETGIPVASTVDSEQVIIAFLRPVGLTLTYPCHEEIDAFTAILDKIRRWGVARGISEFYLFSDVRGRFEEPLVRRWEMTPVFDLCMRVVYRVHGPELR